jgi:transcriptional regulator with XRE-family HTH domain
MSQPHPTPHSESVSEAAPPPTERSLQRALGLRIRSLRRMLDLSVADFATAAGISNGMLSKIENGQISPSLSTLQSIAAALGVPIAGLFTTVDERLHCSFVRTGEGVTIQRRGTKLGHAYELLGHVPGEVAIEPYLITLRQDAVAHTAFQHAGLELIYMLSGELIYRHDEAAYHLRPGDTLLFDSGALHGPQDLLVLPATYLSVIVYPRPDEPRGASPAGARKGRKEPSSRVSMQRLGGSDRD